MPIASRRRLTSEQKRRARRLVGGLEPWAAYYVSEYLAGHGHGPTWRELEAAFGWNQWEGALVVALLVEQGWLREEEDSARLLPGGRNGER